MVTSSRLPAKNPRPDGCICDGSGWLEEWRDDGLGGKWVMVPCQPCQTLDLQRRLSAASGLLPSELTLTLDAVMANGPDTGLMLSLAREFCVQPWGLWTIYGSFGNAKTLILQAVVNHFRRAGCLAVYIRFGDLLDHVRAGYRPEAPEDARERYRRLVEVKCLAIDEVDKPRLTEFATEFQATLLDDRWRYGIEPDPAIRRHTLLSLNSDPAFLPGHIYDRLRDGRFGCWLDDIWYPGITRNLDESMRPAMERSH